MSTVKYNLLISFCTSLKSWRLWYFISGIICDKMFTYGTCVNNSLILEHKRHSKQIKWSYFTNVWIQWTCIIQVMEYRDSTIWAKSVRINRKNILSMFWQIKMWYFSIFILSYERAKICLRISQGSSIGLKCNSNSVPSLGIKAPGSAMVF